MSTSRPPDDLVFCNGLGRPLNDSALRRRYRRAQAASGVRPLRVHDLRHTFGSLLAMRGVDVVTIQKAMGHSALATYKPLPARAPSVRASRGVHRGVRVEHAGGRRSLTVNPVRSGLLRSAAGCRACACRSCGSGGYRGAPSLRRSRRARAETDRSRSRGDPGHENGSRQLCASTAEPPTRRARIPDLLMSASSASAR